MKRSGRTHKDVVAVYFVSAIYLDLSIILSDKILVYAIFENTFVWIAEMEGLRGGCPYHAI